MSKVRIQRIGAALAVLDGLASLPEGERLARFVGEAEASSTYQAGAYVLRCAGLAVTQTSGRAGLLAKWQAKARTTLAGLRERG